MRAFQFQRLKCQASCRCSCHTKHNLATPGLAGYVLGRLFVGYTGLPLIGKGCNTGSCRRKQTACVSMEYWFPPWLLSHIVKLEIAHQPSAGPQMQLTTLRRVPDTANCISFAMTGDIDGMKALFIQGLASPQDVSITRGYSLARVRSGYPDQADSVLTSVTVGSIHTSIRNGEVPRGRRSRYKAKVAHPGPNSRMY